MASRKPWATSAVAEVWAIQIRLVIAVALVSGLFAAWAIAYLKIKEYMLL